MRKQILKLVRQEFSRLLGMRCHMFRQDRKYAGSPGADLYVWDLSEHLKCFIHLLPNPKSYRDSFMIELGWSNGVYPIDTALQNIYRLNVASDGRIRLPNLWREKWESALEPWWEIGESLTIKNGESFHSAAETHRRLNATPEVVKSAIDRIDEFAVPFFLKIAAERGISPTVPLSSEPSKS